MNEVREKPACLQRVQLLHAMKQPGAFQIVCKPRKSRPTRRCNGARHAREFIAKGPSEKELVAAKQNIVGGFPLRIDSNRKILDY